MPRLLSKSAPDQPLLQAQPPPLLLRWGVPMAIVLAAALLKLVLRSTFQEDPSPFLLFSGAVLASALYAGMLGGLVATVAAAFLAHSVFLAEPVARGLRPLAIHAGSDALQLLLFVVEGVAISAVAAALQEARRRAEARELDAQNQEEALRASEERYRLLVEGVQDYVILMLDADGRVVSWNAGAERAYGYAAEDIVGRHYATFYPETDRAMGLPEIEMDILLREERVESIGWRERRDGSRFWASVVMTALRDPTGELRGFSKMTRDITDRKRSEDERAALLAREQAARGRAQASERRHRLLAEAIPQMVWTASPDGSLDYANGRWFEYTGLAADVTRGLGWQRVVHPADLARCRERWDRAIASGEVYEIEVRFRRHDGVYRWQLGRAVPLRDADGTILQWFGTCTDIDDRKRAEEDSLFLSQASAALGSSLDAGEALRALARLAVPRLGDGLRVDLKGEDGVLRAVACAWADPRAAEVASEIDSRFPLRVGDALGPGRVVATGGAELVEAVSEDILRQVAPTPEHRDLLRHLELRAWTSAPLRVRGITEGALTAVVLRGGRAPGPADLALLQELAARAAFAVDNARLFAESRRSNRLKDEFLSTISHELRTPMTSILGWAQMLRTGGLQGAEAARGLEVIHRAARQQAQLIDDLLDISRIIAGKLRIEPRWIDAGAVVEAAIEAVRPAAEARRIRLETRPTPGPAPVHGDPDRLQQVVWNLLSNAIKFTPEGGVVGVDVEPLDGQVRIVVRDSGKGIEPEFLPFAFDRFTQADGSSTRAHGGLGLGLAIVRHLVELHGGSVAAASDGAGRGATFTVTLPTLPIDRRATPLSTPAVVVTLPRVPAPEVNRVLAGLRMLVVDDEPDARELLTAVLRAYGAQVTAVASAGEALEELGRAPHDVLLSDLGLPGVDGYELMRRIRQLAPERGAAIPAAALTAYAGEDARARAIASGFQMHVPKPVEPERLAAAVAALAGRSGAAGERASDGACGVLGEATSAGLPLEAAAAHDVEPELIAHDTPAGASLTVGAAGLGTGGDGAGA